MFAELTVFISVFVATYTTLHLAWAAYDRVAARRRAREVDRAIDASAAIRRAVSVHTWGDE